MATPEEVARKKKVRGAHGPLLLDYFEGWRNSTDEDDSLSVQSRLDEELLDAIPDEDLEEEILPYIIQEDIWVAILKLEKDMKGPT